MAVPLTPALPGALARRLAGLLSPAFVAAVAYVDPGNFATNIESGSRYGFLLLWVVAAASLVAMLLQYLSAKLGLATGRSLPALCHDRFPRPVVLLLWIQAEVVVVMTDLAEFIGGAVALNLLLGLPLLAGGLLVTAASFLILATRTARRRRFEAFITALLAVVAAGFLYALLRSGLPPGAAAGGLVPRFAGSGSVLLAAGAVGATVMPHAIYLHSALTRDRARPGRAAVRAERRDVVRALGVAGLVNMAMLAVAAASLRGTEPTLDGAHDALVRASGPLAGVLFAVALLASGLASSSVGVYAGEVVMEGFLRRRVPLWVRRLATVIPALAVLASGASPTRLLVLSQVALSFGIPFALIPLVLLTARRSVMGALVNRRATTVAAGLCAAVIIALNGVLVAAIGR